MSNAIRIEYAGGDGTMQPAMWYAPAGGQARALVVGLHAWSAAYDDGGHDRYAGFCAERGWAMIYPDFRGPNNKPEACGSELVVADIRAAVGWAKRTAALGDAPVYLVGGSGGGHCSLLMAGRAPELWRAVSAWVPIVDVKAWHYEGLARGNGYPKMIASCCGGEPADGTAAEAEARKRSPLTCLAAAANVPLDINAGIIDGHKGSVPISHSLRAFNALAHFADRLTDEQIAHFVERKAVPPGLEFEGEDPSYGRKRVLFRRASNRVRVTIFDGGHEMVPEAAFAWFDAQA